MIRLKRIKIGFITLILTCATLSSSAVFALPEQARAHAETVPTQATDHSSSEASAQAQAQATANTHLEAAKLTACQNRETAIKTIISRINTRAQNQLNLFSTIANRIETYYTSSGKTVTNYSQLTSAIATAKTNAQTDLSSMQARSSFSCSSSNPHGIVSAFQTDLKTEITDLRTYRTTVKNLIVAVAKAHNVTVNDSSSTSNATGSTNTDTSTSTSTQTGA